MGRRSEQAVERARVAVSELREQQTGPQRLTGAELHAQQLRDIGWDNYQADADGSGVSR